MSILFLFFLFLTLSLARPLEDKVPYLPDVANFTSLYSGYLPLRTSGKYLHYIFVES